MSKNPVFSILIVDDERSNLDVLAHILKSQYTVQIAKSGISALKIVQSKQPDLILLDIVMPEMNGFEVLAELKTSDLTRHIPVIFITGLTQVEDEEKGFLLGAVDYIFKPFKTSIVKARVRTHLRIVHQIRTIERLCMLDALTDIPNRRSFDQHLEQEWNRSIRDNTPISLLSIDVDKFKDFNDTYGHPQGDVALQTLAQMLTAILKRPADFAARVGGEEFAIVLPDTNAEGAMLVAEELRHKVQAMDVPMLDNGEPLSITISIGLTCAIPSVGMQLTDFITKADSALYMAKKLGRNRVCQ